MDELIRKALFKPYLKLHKQSSETPADNWTCRSLLILHEGNSPTLAYFEAVIRSRFPGAVCQLVDTLTTPTIDVDKGAVIVVIRFISASGSAKLRATSTISHRWSTSWMTICLTRPR